MILALLVLAQAASGAAPRATVKVAEVDRRLTEWNGRTVLVRGWMIDCGVGYWSCAIAPRRGDAAHSLRIGGDTPDIDHQFGALAGREVVLRARVDDACRVNRCTDRASVLEVAAIEQVLTPGVRR